MDYILLGTIIGFAALTVLLWQRIGFQTARAEKYFGDLTAFRYVIANPDSSFVLMHNNSTLDAELIQAAYEFGKVKKAKREAKAAAEASTSKLKDIVVDRGPITDPIKLHLIYDDHSKVVHIPTMAQEQVKAIVSETVSKTVQDAIASFMSKLNRRGRL